MGAPPGPRDGPRDGDASRPEDDDDLARLAESTSEEEFLRAVHAERGVRAAEGPRPEPVRIDAPPARTEVAPVASGSTARRSSALAWGLSLVLAVLVFVAFRAVLDAGFTNWDDDKNFVDNERWRGLAPANLAWMFTSFHMAHWHPLTWMSLGLEHVLWGLKPERMHVVNVALHAAGAIAALFVARRIFARVAPAASGLAIDLAAFASAALFAVHPLRAESVAWVTERRDVLSGLLFFLAVLAWLRYVDAADGPARRKRWILSLVLFVLAGMSKVAVFPLPFLLVVLDLWPLGRVRSLGWKRVLVEKAPFFAVTVALMLVAVLGQGAGASALYSLEDYPLPARVVQAGVATWFYPAKTLWPVPLSPMYELPPNDVMFTAPVLGRALAGGAVALVALLAYRVAPALAAAWACFLLVIAPVSGLTQAGSQIAADRYSYLACFPFALLAGGSLFLARRGERGSTARNVGLVVVLALVGVLVVRTSAQAAIWRDSRSLWSHALAVDPANKVACSNMAEVTMQDGIAAIGTPRAGELLRDAIRQLGELYERDPDPRHLLNLANVIWKLADAEPDRADEHLANALKQVDEGLVLARARGPEKPAWHLVRGGVLMELGRVQEALPELRAYVAATPEDPDGQWRLGACLVETNATKEAEPHLRYAVDRGWHDVRATVYLAEAMGRSSRFAEARALWERVIAMQRAALGADAEQDPFVQAARGALKKLEGR